MDSKRNIIRYFAGARSLRGMYVLRNLLVALITTALLPLSFAITSADESSPVGLWRTIDDHTGQPRGLIRIVERDGEYEGRIEKIFPRPGDEPNPRCQKCNGTRRNQPVLGMTIMTNLKKQDDQYGGGEILDPETGKTYSVRLKLEDQGRKLDVRGFIGVSLLGRSQTWLREE